MQDNPIIHQFRAAGRLVNEWRDTLFYTALGAMTASQLISQGTLPDNIFFFVANREIFRASCWQNLQPSRIVGDRSVPLNYTQLSGCAMTVALFAIALHANQANMNAIFSYALQSTAIIAGSVLCLLVGGPNAVFKAYKDTMWDWPRKRGDGGGTTQTQKLKDGFSKLGKKLSQPFGARPIPAPVGARIRHTL